MERPARIILASQSPRRRELLALIGIPHEVMPADIDESVLPDESPPAHAERLAREKAEVISAREPAADVVPRRGDPLRTFPPRGRAGGAS